MKIRAHVYALAALAAGVPAAALAVPVVQTTVSPTADVVARSTVQVTCYAEGRNASGMTGAETIQSIAVSVSGGSVSPATIPGPAVITTTCPATGLASCNVLQGSASWETPVDPATLTATCTASYLGGFTGTTAGTVSSSAPLTTIAGAALPPAISAVNGPAEVVTGTIATFEAVASDPNDPPQPLTYSWAATGGTVTPDPTNPALAAWEAPATRGTHQLTVTVSNGATSAAAQKSVSAVLATYQAALPLPLSAPRRLATGSGGALYVVDGQQGATGQVALATARGEVRGFATLPEPALAVASGAGLLWVTTAKGSIYKLDPITGRTKGKVALAGGPFASPIGVAYDAASMTLWVADKDANRVRIVTPDGATVGIITHVNGAELIAPIDVAIDAARGKAWVLVFQAKKALAAGEPEAAARFLHAFDLGGRYLASYVPPGGSPGQLTRAAGLAVGPAGVYVSDAYQGAVQVLASDGTPVGTVGAWGEGAGQILNPTGLAVMGNGDLAVASTSVGKIERFGSGAALPTCADDTDCDGLPDAWEIANGLDAAWAGNALLDLDGDGLNDAEEHAAGTRPRAADSDGDGYSDSDELASGFDPLDGDDHRAMVTASGPHETTPGLVRLSALASGPGGCSLAWTQKAGPAVRLGGATTASPTFVARAAGSYAFDAVATCGGVQSDPGRATVVVKNVPPLADAGRLVVAPPGSPIRLDALASSDANGDALAFTWDQTLGPPLVGTEIGGTLVARPRGAGLYAFQVTVADPSGATSTAEVPVLVSESLTSTAIAAALPAEAEEGSTVVLDASTSVVRPGAVFAWQQVAGPAATLSGADQAVAFFVPSAPGRHVFEVTAGNGAIRSPAARVEVFVAEQGGALPTVTASAPSVVAVGQPVSLEATPNPSRAEVRWRQVSGPAAGLTDADAASATVVAFAPGFHVFEVAVAEGAVEGRAARVAFEARSGGTAIPQASIATPAGDAWVGQLVFLDGRASTGAARFRWTQVAGPWVALGSQSSVTTFRPLAPGLHAFELVVDDGAIRSAPARVEVNVVSPPEGVQ